MAQIVKPNTFTPNTTISSSQVNDNFDTIYNEFNGNISAANLATDAVTTGKITDANVTTAKLASGAVTADKIDSSILAGWQDLGVTPNTVTNNGNRSYDLVFNSTDLTDTLSPGMRLRTTRTVTAPTQCADLESGSSQYFNDTSVTGMTFTDDFVVSAWVKLESYTAGYIASRWNGTSGWGLLVNANGTIQLFGTNAGAGNSSYVLSYQSIPLNKWVHVTAQLDMSTFTATTTTSYVMLDGVDVPASVARSGTNPTALVQAGNLEIGAANAGTSPFDGKIAQVAIYSAKVTQATIKASMNQALSGTETSLVSAYSFNNSINDLNANANNLTAQGSAVATNADSPFADGPNLASGYTDGTTDFGIVTKTAFSTNTTVTVQVPEGCTIPTSGGVSAVAYSTQASPYGWPGISKVLASAVVQANSTTTSTTATQLNGASVTLTLEPGEYRLKGFCNALTNSNANAIQEMTIWDGVPNVGTKLQGAWSANGSAGHGQGVYVEADVVIPTSASKTYNLGFQSTGGTTTAAGSVTTPVSIKIEKLEQ